MRHAAGYYFDKAATLTPLQAKHAENVFDLVRSFDMLLKGLDDEDRAKVADHIADALYSLEKTGAGVRLGRFTSPGGDGNSFLVAVMHVAPLAEARDTLKVDKQATWGF